MVSKSKILGKSAIVFVTIGSTNFIFDRLFEAIDAALLNLGSEARLIIQSGNSSYKWHYKNSKQMEFTSPTDLKDLCRGANKVITHGGFGTLHLLSSTSKFMPLIVARLPKFMEHINNHQVEYVSYIKNKHPLLYYHHFLCHSKIQNDVSAFLAAPNKKNVLKKYLFHSKGEISKKLDIYIDSL